MKPVAPIRVRLFLVAWIGCALFFATNIVREHYPAFALAADGTLRCDEWAEVLPDPRTFDLFRHADGHWYANSNVGASLVAAPVLFLFEPLLRRLDERGKTAAAERGGAATFESDYQRRQQFMQAVFARGLHLRLGAAAAITATLVMAPLAGVLALLMHRALTRRGVATGRAAALALLLVFGTPVVFRSAILNHNQMEAVAAFAAFLLLWRPDPAGAARRFAAGVLAGACVLLDYSGVVLLAGLGIYLLVVEHPRTRRLAATARAALPFAAGAALPLGLLAWLQWRQFGDPFRPAQHWMPDAHFSVRGYHGFALPDLGLFWKNLFDPSFGIFFVAPLLLLAFVPRRGRRGSPPATAGTTLAEPILPRRERLFVFALAAAFLLFCAANQFTRLQWNTGFRGLAPLVPFLFLAACDRPTALACVAVPSLLHSGVLAMSRATWPGPQAPASFGQSAFARSWAAFHEHGLQLPWLTTWRQTLPDGGPPWLGFAATGILVGAGLLFGLLWWGLPRGKGGRA